MVSEQEVIKILNQLSDTGNRAFEILVQQAIFDAGICLVILILSTIFSTVVLIKHNKVLDSHPSNDEKRLGTVCNRSNSCYVYYYILCTNLPSSYGFY